MRCPRVIIGAFFAVGAFSLLAAGCGGSPRGDARLGTGTTTTASAAANGNPSSGGAGGALAQYASCMRARGVSNFPDEALWSSVGIRAEKTQINRISASETSSPTFQAAQRICARYAPRSQPPAHVSPQEMQKLLGVSRCMRAHGVPSFPDPNPATGDFATPAGIDKNSPQVLGALRACSSLGQAAGLGRPNTAAP